MLLSLASRTVTFGSVAKILKSSGSCVPMVASEHSSSACTRQREFPRRSPLIHSAKRMVYPMKSSSTSEANKFERDKWFRKTHQAVGRVEIENIPDDEPTLKLSRRRGHKAEPEGIQVTIQTGDGLHLRKVDLNYQGLKTLVEKLEGLC